MKLTGEWFSALLGKLINYVRGHTYVFRGADGRKLFKIRVGRDLHEMIVEQAMMKNTTIDKYIVDVIRRFCEEHDR